MKETEDLAFIKKVTDDKKISFAKLMFSKNRGPYLVAFENSCIRGYAEMNALECKNVNINEIKQDKVPLWEAGAKNPEEINALPKLDLKKQKEKVLKEKEERKAKRADKMKATIAKKRIQK